MEKQVILVGQSNDSRHSVWEASESMGCDLRWCNISTRFSLFRCFGYALQRVINWISHLVKIYSSKDGPLEKLWGWVGGGGGIFEPREISLIWNSRLSLDGHLCIAATYRVGPCLFLNSLSFTLYKADISLSRTLSGRSHWGSQRRFPPKFIQNTF